MGDIQQVEFMKALSPMMKGPILEIGSKRQGEPPLFFDYRTFFPREMKYVGVDIDAGEGVDVVVDMTAEIGVIKSLLDGLRFNSVICLSVMEHVKDIYSFAQNVEALMNPGALAVISIPFAWELHAYPHDFWRFTPGAIEFLFPSIVFDPALSQLHTDSGKSASLSEAQGDFNKYMKMLSLPRQKKTMEERMKRAAIRAGNNLKRIILGLKKDAMPLHSTSFEMVGFKKT
jgi:hypothetical protein